MSIVLQPAEEELRSKIRDAIAIAKLSTSRNDVRQAIVDGGNQASTLHGMLQKRGLEPKHRRYMINNRGCAPASKSFYEHIHPMEDLLKFIDDEHANDDPKDMTVGALFIFRVYSNRWGHDDVYEVERTGDGWKVNHFGNRTVCDKGGRPGLFEELQHDWITYPTGLDDCMERLWIKAEEKGLSVAAVQAALQELADWVSATEKATPAAYR